MGIALLNPSYGLWAWLLLPGCRPVIASNLALLVKLDLQDLHFGCAHISHLAFGEVIGPLVEALAAGVQTDPHAGGLAQPGTNLGLRGGTLLDLGCEYTHIKIPAQLDSAAC